MREIKFRGISTYSNDWVKGGYLNTVFKDKTDDHRIYPLLYNVNPHAIKPETLGQFIGLKDKNGVEIYEGDIILHGIAKTKSKVVFKDGSFALDNEKSRHDTCIRHYDTKECEVIGNIHENPELLCTSQPT